MTRHETGVHESWCAELRFLSCVGSLHCRDVEVGLLRSLEGVIQESSLMVVRRGSMALQLGEL